MNFFRKKRLKCIFFVFMIMFMLLSVHLLNIQVVRGDNYALKALEQDTEKVVLEDVSRGQILDQNLRSLTDGGVSYRIVIFPELMIEKEIVETEISKILGVEVGELKHYFNGPPCYLPYQLTNKQIQKIKDSHNPGITLQSVHFRYGNYPLANHLIGHLGKIPSNEDLEQLNYQGNKTYYISDLVGKMGLEKYYDYDLKANYPGQAVRVHRDAHGNLVKSSNLLSDLNSNTNRRDLVLTIDKDIQRIVEQVMDVRVKKGAVVIMDVTNGEIVAMASRPNFDPRHIEDYLSGNVEEVFLNRSVSLYQPGSIFKVVVAAAALEEGIVDEKTVFTCLGEQDKLISCWYYAGHGRINFSKAFSESCNPAFAQLGLKLGAEKIISYARLFGLDNQSIIGYPIPSDQRQDLKLIAKKYNLVNSSIGQGPVLTTPVQITALLRTIADNGLYKKPQLVKEIRENGKIVKNFSKDNGTQVISEKTAKELKVLLELVTTEGVGTEAYVQGYGSAGKTGSAQTGDQGGTVNAWFSGFAPSDDPKYVVTVLVEESVSGGESAAPVFRQLMERILPLNK